MTVAKDAFTINHHESMLSTGSRLAGANLLTNPDAETGDLTGWTASSPGFSAATSASIGPTPMHGTYAFSAGAAAGSKRRTLESDRVAVTAGTRYFLGFIFGTQHGAKRKNNLKAQIRWWNAPAGGSQVGTSTVYAKPVPASGRWNSVFRAKRAPAGATHASVFFKNAWRSSTGSVDVKDTTAIDDVIFAASVTQVRPNLIEHIRHKVTGYPLTFDGLRWSNNARVGYKEANFTLYGLPDDLWRWAPDALMQHIEIYFGPTRRFEGYVTLVDGVIDGKPVRYSMDSVFNDCVVDGATGTRGTIRRRAQDEDSIKRRGRKMWYESDDNLLNEDIVQARATYLLNRHSEPKNLKPFDEGGADSLQAQNNMLQITVSGYLMTLSFLEFVAIWYGYGVDTSVIIATGDGVSNNLSILNTARRLFGNEFISDDYANVSTTGVVLRWSGGSTKKKEEGNAYSFVEELLNMGDSSRELLVSGVWKDRKFLLKSRPTTVEYQRRRESDGTWKWYDASAASLENAMVDSGKFVRTPRTIPSWTTYDDAYDDPDAAFLWEIEYDAENDTLVPIPPDADLLERGLAHAFQWVVF